MTGLYIMMGLVAAAAVIVLLSFIGPEKSDKPFWIKVQKMRSVLDKISYWIICAIAIGTILIVIVNILIRLIGK